MRWRRARAGNGMSRRRANAAVGRSCRRLCVLRQMEKPTRRTTLRSISMMMAPLGGAPNDLIVMVIVIADLISPTPLVWLPQCTPTPSSCGIVVMTHLRPVRRGSRPSAVAELPPPPPERHARWTRGSQGAGERARRNESRQQASAAPASGLSEGARSGAPPLASERSEHEAVCHAEKVTNDAQTAQVASAPLATVPAIAEPEIDGAALPLALNPKAEPFQPSVRLQLASRESVVPSAAYQVATQLLSPNPAICMRCSICFDAGAYYGSRPLCPTCYAEPTLMPVIAVAAAERMPGQSALPPTDLPPMPASDALPEPAVPACADAEGLMRAPQPRDASAVSPSWCLPLVYRPPVMPHFVPPPSISRRRPLVTPPDPPPPPGPPTPLVAPVSAPPPVLPPPIHEPSPPVLPPPIPEPSPPVLPVLPPPIPEPPTSPYARCQRSPGGRLIHARLSEDWD